MFLRVLSRVRRVPLGNAAAAVASVVGTHAVDTTVGGYEGTVVHARRYDVVAAFRWSRAAPGVAVASVSQVLRRSSPVVGDQRAIRLRCHRLDRDRPDVLTVSERSTKRQFLVHPRLRGDALGGDFPRASKFARSSLDRRVEALSPLEFARVPRRVLRCSSSGPRSRRFARSAAREFSSNRRVSRSVRSRCASPACVARHPDTLRDIAGQLRAKMRLSHSIAR